MGETLSISDNTNAGFTQSVYEPWPNYWTAPTTYHWPMYHNSFIYTNPPAEQYANEVEVQQHEHDATLRFYRKRGTQKTLVKEITVPLGVLRWLQGEE